jgi:hypothetical protein
MRARIVVLLGAGALLLSGCTAAAPTPTPSATPLTISGSAATQRTLSAPAGTRSAALRLTCTGGGAVLTIGQEVEPRSVECGTPRSLTVPVADRTLALSLDPGQGGSFTATVRFSSKPFRADAGLTAQCAIASTAISDVISADNGLTTGALDADGAHALMAQAEATLNNASFDGAAGGELSTLRTWLDAHPEGDPRQAPVGRDIGRLCADNESPLLLQSAYGG